MGDRAILGSGGIGDGSVSTVSRLEGNSAPTPQYTERRTVTWQEGNGTTSKDVYLTPEDAKAYDTWDKPNVSVATNGTTVERLKRTISEWLEGR